VLHNEDVKAYALRRGVAAPIMMGMLVGVLARLVEHYGEGTLKPSVFEEAAAAR